jgi:hypothetical protein
VNYEFKHIEELVLGAVESLKSKGKSVAKSVAKIQDTVRQESDRTQSSYALKMLEFESESQVIRSVQFHELKLVSLIDALYDQLPDEARILLTSLEDLIEFLRTSFEVQFRADFAAPITYRERALNFAKEVSNQLRQRWPNSTEDQTLEGVVQDCLANFIKSGSTKASFARVEFIMSLCNTLTEVLLSDIKPDRVRRLLMEYNFSEPKFSSYYIEFIERQLAQAQTLREQIEILAKALKDLNQTVSRLTPLDLKSGSIRRDLLNWVGEELHFLETKTRIDRIQSSEPAANEFKLILDMSVAQLALLVKVLVDTSTIQNKNVSELLRFFAQIAKTKRSESVSYESLRIKYYNPEESTKEIVKIVLGNCLRQLA